MNNRTEGPKGSPRAGSVGEAVSDWDNIPEELRQRAQWAVANPKDKIPHMPTGGKASVSNPKTWTTFENARAAAGKKGWAIGFMLADDDPFTIIDLDDKADKPASEEEKARHRLYIEKFDSYTERSISGRGFHIVVRGTVPEGARRGHVEVYSSERFMLCTGDSVDAEPKPIVEKEELLTKLYEAIKHPKPNDIPIASADEKASDEQILERAFNADNADNFRPLWEGIWEGKYVSQSEADMGLISMLHFYTQNVDQLFRLFRQSELGKREKARKNDDYLTRTLKKFVRGEHPPIDFSNLRLPTPTSLSSETPPELNFPPGLMGEIARHFYASATRPVKEVAISAAIGLLAGICGRYYNISESGLNLYVILLAGTGVGKSGAGDSIDALLWEVQQRGLSGALDQFMGPSDFSSGQALLRALPEKPCFVSVLGEIGHTLQQISHPKASTYETAFRKALLDLYSKNGAKKFLRGKAYAALADNIPTISSPSVSILGEATPQSFYEGMNAGHIKEGLIPRFLILESVAPRPPRNKTSGGKAPEAVVSRLSELVQTVLDRQGKSKHQPLYETVQKVTYASAAEVLLDEFDVRCDERINGQDEADVEKELWNRAHLNALRLAALVAVGESPQGPTISLDAAKWAIEVVERSVQGVAKHFRQGDFGDHDTKRRSEVLRLMDKFSRLPLMKRISYGCQNKAVAGQPVVPYKYLVQNTSNLAAFKRHRGGASTALKETLAHMVDAGDVQQIPAGQLNEWGATNTRAKFYCKGC